MTGDPLLDIAASLAATALLVGLSFALGAWRNATVDEMAAARRLAVDEPDFCPFAWLVSSDKRAAVAIDAAGGEYAVVFAIGDGYATRRLVPGARPVVREGRSLTIRLGELSRRRVMLTASDENAAADWAGRLCGRALS